MRLEGNTPAYAGKTKAIRFPTWPKRKHPHLRGEDPSSVRLLPCIKETPPLTRGRLAFPLRLCVFTGNTPAYAGKTRFPLPAGPIPTETPPLTRGRRWTTLRQTPRPRNTPAYAGKTLDLAKFRMHQGKHPRLRGEDEARTPAPFAVPETPPLTRGRPHYDRRRRKRARNTPAYAGKTFFVPTRLLWDQKHPRLRGEDKKVRRIGVVKMETPPLTRGRPGDKITSIRPNRNTPAYAGKTFRSCF